MLAEMFETESILLETFETDAALKNWHSINGGRIELSEERCKIGTKSLKWYYKKDSVLKLTDYPSLARLNEYPGAQGIKLWIYNQDSVDDDMIIKIGKSSLVAIAPAYQFKVHMRFQGWRAVWIRLNLSAKTPSTHVMSDLDSMQLELPPAMGEGTLYLDAFEVMESVSYLLCPDFQVPYLPTWSTGAQYAAYCRIPENTQVTECTAGHIQAFQVISERLDNYILPPNVDIASLDSAEPLKIRYDALLEVIKKNIQRYDSYHIRREANGTLKGPGILASADQADCSCVKFSEFEQIWAALVLDYKINHNEASREKLMTLFDFFHDQGWAEGSSCGAMRFDEIRSDGYAYAVYMMRRELAQTRRLEREIATLKWRSEFGNVFTYNDPELSSIVKLTCDVIRSVVFFQFLYIISMEDSPLKVFYMQQYIEYLQQYIILPKGGIENGIKTDYTFWNHQGPYMSAYGLEALNILCQLKYLLHDTCFDLNKESTEVLNRALRVYRVSSNKTDLPLRLRGRFPEDNGTMIVAAVSYAFMAACGNKEMEKIFLDIWDISDPVVYKSLKGFLPDGKDLLPSLSWIATLGQLKLYMDILNHAKEEGIEPSESLNGSFVFPYGGYFIYRQNNWMLAVSGWSCYIWDYENGGGVNLYGRYMNYGSATIVPEGGFAAGGIDTLHGWDWNRWPGATTKHLPESALRNNEEMRFQAAEAFLGGIAAQNGSGIYAMQLHDAHFDPSFRANKSWFCFGDEIICLGSDISNDDAEHDTETTLFQCGMGDNCQLPFSFNGSEITEFPYQKTIETAKSVWLTDPYENGYVIPNAKGLNVKRGMQKSKTSSGEDSTGSITAAYFSHRTKPCNAGYEYVIFPHKGAKQLEYAAKNPDYTVLQKNCRAHIVKHHSSSAIGYAVFETEEPFSYGVLKRVDTPCVVMETMWDNGNIMLSITDPDLRLCDVLPSAQGKKSPHRLTAVMRGAWEIKNGGNKARIKTGNGNTVLEIDCIDGKQIDVLLEPLNW